jgi:ornithine carbamoyltransferase
LELVDRTQTVFNASDASAPVEPLQGQHVALLMPLNVDLQVETFELAAQRLGARLALLDSDAWLQEAHSRWLQSVAMLGRLYGLMDCCGLDASIVKAIQQHADVPVLNGIALASHPIHLVADILAVSDVQGRPIGRLRLLVKGDASAPWSRMVCALAHDLHADVVGDGDACDAVWDASHGISRGRLSAGRASPLASQALAQAAARYRFCLTQALLVWLMK